MLGWTRPSNQGVAVQSNIQTIATGTYNSLTGSIEVILAPQDAASTGAQWKVIEVATGEESELQISGSQLDGLAPGDYSLLFTDVNGWLTPVTQTLTVVTGQVEKTTGIYDRQTGDITVSISPMEATNANAQWKLVGLGGDFDSGFQSSDTQLEEIPVGEYNLQFRDIPGWDTPDQQSVTINADTLTSVAVQYIRITGAVTVTITPQEVIDAGAQWKISGVTGSFNSDFQDSGVILSDIPIGLYNLEFREIDDWTTAFGSRIRIDRDKRRWNWLFLRVTRITIGYQIHGKLRISVAWGRFPTGMKTGMVIAISRNLLMILNRGLTQSQSIPDGIWFRCRRYLLMMQPLRSLMELRLAPPP